MQIYLSVVINEQLCKTIGHGRNISEVLNIKIQLPMNFNNEINFDYI